ncbi:hypothetical protein ABBQ38_010329 [Trebouxia sp. C0009 RCD-2024]
MLHRKLSQDSYGGFSDSTAWPAVVLLSRRQNQQAHLKVLAHAGSIASGAELVHCLSGKRVPACCVLECHGILVQLPLESCGFSIGNLRGQHATDIAAMASHHKLNGIIMSDDASMTAKSLCSTYTVCWCGIGFGGYADTLGCKCQTCLDIFGMIAPWRRFAPNQVAGNSVPVA